MNKALDERVRDLLKGYGSEVLQPDTMQQVNKELAALAPESGTPIIIFIWDDTSGKWEQKSVTYLGMREHLVCYRDETTKSFHPPILVDHFLKQLKVPLPGECKQSKKKAKGAKKP